MPHFVVLLARGVSYAKSFTVLADERVDGPDAYTFVRDGRPVHRVPRAYVADMLAFDDAKQASDRLADHRRALAAGASFTIEEGSAPAPKAKTHAATTAIPAEGITFRVEER